MPAKGKTSIPRPAISSSGRTSTKDEPSENKENLSCDSEKSKTKISTRRGRPLLQGPFRPSVVDKMVKSNEGVAPATTTTTTRTASSMTQRGRIASGNKTKDEAAAAPNTRTVSTSRQARNTNGTRSPVKTVSPPRKPRVPKAHPVVIPKSPTNYKRVSEMREQIHTLETDLSSAKEQIQELEGEIGVMRQHEKSMAETREENDRLQTLVEELRKDVTSHHENLERLNLDPVSLEKLALEQDSIDEKRKSATEAVATLTVTVKHILSSNETMASELKELIKAAS